VSSGRFHQRHEVKSIPLKVQIRWMIRRDMAEVLRIERESFEYHWTEEDFLCCLRQRNCIGMVAEADGQVVGLVRNEVRHAGSRSKPHCGFFRHRT